MKSLKYKPIVELILFAMILSGIGMGIGYYMGYKQFNESGVYISSIEDGQVVHSVVVIDAVFKNAESIKIYINDTLVSNASYYEWNNIHYPAGTYEIKVESYKNDNLDDTDIKYVIIPEEWIVPLNYNFTEDFVVHTGQTVNLTGNFNISDDNYINGYTPYDEQQYYSINVFGTLIIDGNVTCNEFTVENNGVLDWKNGNITVNGQTELIYNNQKMAGGHIRLDDNAELYLNGQTYIQQTYSGITSLFVSDHIWVNLIENATFVA